MNERIKLPFTKMQGCKNDYVYINCFDEKINSLLTEFANTSKLKELIKTMSDRHTGIGSDGVILICPSNVADAEMRMFNLDGSEGKMCGNGIRCVAKYVYDSGIAQKETLKIATKSGVKTLYLTIENNEVSRVRVDMGQAELNPAKIPVIFNGDTVVSEPLNIKGSVYKITCVSMGNPHAVIFMDGVDSLNIAETGPLFENNLIFPESVNTEFVEIIDKTTLKMRVWERGSGETQACGTGACAVAVAAVLNGHCEKNADITVKLLGGDLIIRYTDETVYMTGDCVKTFEGVFEL